MQILHLNFFHKACIKHNLTFLLCITGPFVFCCFCLYMLVFFLMSKHQFVNTRILIDELSTGLMGSPGRCYNFCSFWFFRESRGLSSACSVERGTGVGPAQTFLSSETPPASTASVSSYRRLDERPCQELYERIQEITVQR